MTTQRPAGDLVKYGSGEISNSTGSLLNSTSGHTTTSEIHGNATDFVQSNPQPVLAIVLILIALFICLGMAVGVWKRYQLNLKRRQNQFHMPIVEYKEDNISVSTFSSAGYGTYTDLEDCYLSGDTPSRIDGQLKLSLFCPKTDIHDVPA